MTGMPQGWRDVPMPKGVAALPRTTSGIPITYTVAWSSERVPVAREDPVLVPRIGRGHLALFHSGRQGEGTPKLAFSDVARTRRVVVEGLCQACGRKLPGRSVPPWRQHPRWLCDLRNYGQEIQMGARRVPLIVDGWTCESCLAYALLVCPGLVAKTAAADLRLLRVRDAELVLTIEEVEGLDEQVIGWVKIAPTSFDVVPPAEFLCLPARVAEAAPEVGAGSMPRAQSPGETHEENDARSDFP